jgi:putative phosphoesterase
MKIGVISDTHNYFDPKIAELFEGVGHILHAGDIGTQSILLQLEQIAPVTAVMGNTDDPAFGYRQSDVYEGGGYKFLVHHIVNPYELSETVSGLIARHRPDAVVFGHSHKPFCEIRNGRLFFNPGYAGKQRFALPRSVGILECAARGIRHRFLPL